MKIIKELELETCYNSLEKEGLDIKKLKLTINNLKDSDKSIKFYVDRNLKKNVVFLKKKIFIF